MNWRNRISIDPAVCHGQACIRGTRVLVSVILDNLAANIPVNEILAGYPSLEPIDIQSAISYAAELSKERVFVVPETAIA